MERVATNVANTKESTLLGAYADTRQWEAEMWRRDDSCVPGPMPNDAEYSSSDEDDE
eukprot:SAG31_NODE_18815_length_621_cov_4.247126_1_plen_57_part_00